MIYYHPAPIKENSDSASGIRPRKMLEAFRSAGFEVEEVCGYGAERKRSIERVRSNLERGISYSFAYGENTTLPFPLNEPSHVPFYPFQDYLFWRWLKEKGIPFGCFYRDIYWRYPEFRKGIALHKWAVPLPFHYIDAFLLKKYATIVFLPSEGVAASLPFYLPEGKVRGLPPGCEMDTCRNEKIPKRNRETLNCFYAGGILPPNYDLSPMLDLFSSPQSESSLTLCCRKAEWEAVDAKKTYGMIPRGAITVIHKKGAELRQHWEEASVFLALWGDTAYHDCAMPLKIFDAIGNCTPIITTRGNAAGDFVEQNGFGWAIEPDPSTLGRLLNRLIDDRSLLEEKRMKMLSERHKHTWEARARFAAETLIGTGALT